MVTLSERCPLCKKVVKLEVSEARIKNRSSYPVAFVDNEITLTPEPHRHIFYVDSHFSCRGVAYALVSVGNIENLKFLTPETNLDKNIYFFIVDYKNNIADCRLMENLNYRELVFEIQNMANSLKLYSSNPRKISHIEFKLSLDKKLTGLTVTAAFFRRKFAVYLYLGELEINLTVLKEIISKYSPDFSTAKLKFLVNLVLQEKHVYKGMLRYFLDDRRIKYINFRKIRTTVPILKSEINILLNRLEKTLYKGKTLFQLASTLKVDPLTLAQLILMLDHYNTIDFQ